MDDIEYICRETGLPKGDVFTQDWVYELPEAYRTEEYLCRYMVAYSNDHCPESVKDILMELILDVSKDLLSQGYRGNDEVIVNVFGLLRDNYQKHLKLIECWSLDDELLEDCFALTPFVRGLNDKNK